MTLQDGHALSVGDGQPGALCGDSLPYAPTNGKFEWGSNNLVLNNMGRDGVGVRHHW